MVKGVKLPSGWIVSGLCVFNNILVFHLQNVNWSYLFQMTKNWNWEKVVLKVSIVNIKVYRPVIFLRDNLTVFIPAVLGYATTVIPRWFTYYASSALFAVFGIKMLKEGYLVFIYFCMYLLNKWCWIVKSKPQNILLKSVNVQKKSNHDMLYG